jgi:hypothetical protein
MQKTVNASTILARYEEGVFKNPQEKTTVYNLMFAQIESASPEEQGKMRLAFAALKKANRDWQTCLAALNNKNK